MGLAANIPTIESARSIEIAQGVAIAFGDSRALARAVMLTTGSDRLAQATEIRAQMKRGLDG